MTMNPEDSKQMLIGVVVALTSALLAFVIVFSILLVRKRIKDKQLLLW